MHCMDLLRRQDLDRGDWVWTVMCLWMASLGVTGLTSEDSPPTSYDNGLTKLVETAVAVTTMQEELTALQPMLVIATTDTDALLVTIATETTQANASKTLVKAEEATCNEQAAAANLIKTSCEAELAEAIPALEAAVQALNTITKGDLTEVKAMSKPPAGVKLVIDAVCIMMRVAPEKIKDPNGGTSWEIKERMRNEGSFIQYSNSDSQPESSFDFIHSYSNVC